MVIFIIIEEYAITEFKNEKTNTFTYFVLLMVSLLYQKRNKILNLVKLCLLSCLLILVYAGSEDKICAYALIEQQWLDFEGAPTSNSI